MHDRIRVLLLLLSLLAAGVTAHAEESGAEPEAGAAATPAPDAAPAAAPDATPLPRFPSPRLPPRHRLLLGNLTVARMNPTGLEHQLRAGWQRRLFVAEAPLFRDNFFFLGTTPKINPAYTRIGPTAEIQPLSIFNLRASAEFVGFYSTFGFVQSFRDPTVDYRDSRLDRLADEEAAYATYGTHASLEPTVQLKVGSVVVRNKFTVDYWHMELLGDDTVFYEASFDTLLPRRGFSTSNDLDVLYQTNFGLTAGLRHSFVRPIYRESDFKEGGDPGWVENRHHRLGTLLAYTFHDRGYTRFNRPTVLVISSWYLSHRWRTGEDVSQAVPYVVLGFAFQTDLLDYAFDP